MLPARFAPYLFSLILSGMMSFVVSGFATFKSLGALAGFTGLWLQNWPVCWAIAFPTALLAAPGARALVAVVTRPIPAPRTGRASANVVSKPPS